MVFYQLIKTQKLPTTINEIWSFISSPPIKSGVLMTDVITYQPPMGILGAIANSLVLKRQLQKIFDYRIVALGKRFGNFKQ